MNKVLIINLFVALSYFSSMAQKNYSLFEKEIFILENDTLLYRIMYPINFSKDKEYPVILFLHGSGERGNDNEKQLIHGSNIFSSDQNRKDFPSIVIFPQCSENDYWSKIEVDRSASPNQYKYLYSEPPTQALQLVSSLIDSFLVEDFTKKDQIYVMGLSMGGMGTFEIVYRKQNTFAAAIPICGGGNPEFVKSFAKDIAFWVFHGAQDNVVNPRLSIQMVEAILKEGGFPKFTLYDDANHNSWDSAFAETDLLSWLFSKKNTKN